MANMNALSEHWHIHTTYSSSNNAIWTSFGQMPIVCITINACLQFPSDTCKKLKAIKRFRYFVAIFQFPLSLFSNGEALPKIHIYSNISENVYRRSRYLYVESMCLVHYTTSIPPTMLSLFTKTQTYLYRYSIRLRQVAHKNY